MAKIYLGTHIRKGVHGVFKLARGKKNNCQYKLLNSAKILFKTDS